MSLQEYLVRSFPRYKPPPPEAVSRSKHDITLAWDLPGLEFLSGGLVYQLQRKDKLPPWVLEYSGGKRTKRIDNLMPCCPHKFRVRVIVLASTVPHLANLAATHYGSEELARKLLDEVFGDLSQLCEQAVEQSSGDSIAKPGQPQTKYVDESGDTNDNKGEVKTKSSCKWLESQWSDVMSANTESMGASAVCFCMAVYGGYMKHVQAMLEERPELVGIINSSNGFTPLATAVRTGDMSMVRYLVSAGAAVDQAAATGQTPLQLAVLGRHTAIADLLLEKGADFQLRDNNGMRVEHYAVDSGDVATLRHVLARGGDVTVADSNGWTPLFRAVVQGAPAPLVEELVRRGSDVTARDARGMALAAAARCFKDRHGRAHEWILRLVEPRPPPPRARAALSRVSKKIATVHSLLKH